MRVFYLLFAAVDLPFLLCRQGKHGFSVFLCEVKLILQREVKIAVKVKTCWREEGEERTLKEEENSVMSSQCFICYTKRIIL